MIIPVMQMTESSFSSPFQQTHYFQSRPFVHNYWWINSVFSYSNMRLFRVFLKLCVISGQFQRDLVAYPYMAYPTAKGASSKSHLSLFGVEHVYQVSGRKKYGSFIGYCQIVVSFAIVSIRETVINRQKLYRLYEGETDLLLYW